MATISRPAVGPVGGRTKKIITELFERLCDVDYLQLSRASGLPTVGRATPEKQARFLSTDETALMREALGAHPEPEPSRRRATMFAIDAASGGSRRRKPAHAASLR
ncbi:hypothetical protein [Paraburkholderia sabiae]|uniref:hypothetical protein n=1 Tax=Paraburkholderia sabiae TaxID=273251 RepID=UPI00319E41F3